jgi:hypothetical protein
VPLVEIAAGVVHPKLGMTTTQLLDRAEDQSEVRRMHGAK